MAASSPTSSPTLARWPRSTSVDGYRFAMFRNPESNPIGLIDPFAG